MLVVIDILGGRSNIKCITSAIHPEVCCFLFGSCWTIPDSYVLPKIIIDPMWEGICFRESKMVVLL